MTYTATIEFKATELTPDVSKIESWFWGHATIGQEVTGNWMLSTFDINDVYSGTLDFAWGDYAVLEHDGLVIYPADVFHAKFTEVKDDE